MLNTMMAKVAAMVFALFAALGVLLISTVDDSARALQLEANQKLHLALATNIAKDSPLWLDQGLATKSVENALHTMMLIGPAMELYIVAPDGQLLNYSDPEGKVVRKTINMMPLQKFLKDSSMLPIVGDDPRSLTGQKIFSVAPLYPNNRSSTEVATSVTNNNSGNDSGNNSSVNNSVASESLPPPVAYLYIIIGGQQYDSVYAMLDSSHFARLGVSTILAGVALCGLLMMLLFLLLTKPLRQLLTGLADFKARDFLQVPASLPTGNSALAKGNSDELNQLLCTVHDMAQRIVDLFQHMISNSKGRQELITHISHDLRTPLASIRGYLERWQLSQSATDAEAKHCVQIALRNCSQLEHMVDELFELSRLEANVVSANPEAFPLLELIDDILQKLQLKAQAKQVQLLCHSTGKLPLAFADIGHINRIFINLLDNAIRHSHIASQVVINVSFNQALQRLDIGVADSGDGIPLADLPQLFEPYFRASNQDQHYQQGTGLGLAITKRLLLLHGAAIHVESTQHVGSVFSFWIPVE